jgi:opacity protein-like surface antigen
MKTIVTALVLAAALAAPALAQRSQTQQGAQPYSGSYQSYPSSEWYRPDSW